MTLALMALAVLNACAAGTEPDREDVLRLRHAAAPDAAEWPPEELASLILAEETRRAASGKCARASE